MYITGLEIGFNALHIITIKVIGSGYHIVEKEKIAIDLNDSTDDLLQDTLMHLRKSLNYLKKKWPFRMGKISLIVPDNYVSCKDITLNVRANYQDLQSAVLHAFSQQSDCPIADLYIDYVESESSKENHSVFTIYAVKKEVIEPYLKILKRAKYTPILIDMHSNALLTIWRKAAQIYDHKQDWLLMELGEEALRICIFSSEIGCYYKDVSLTNSVSENVYQQQLFEQIQRQIQLYLASDSHHAIEGIWLVGDASISSSWLESKLHRPVEQVDVLSLFGVDDISASNKDHNYTLAIGAVMNGERWLQLSKSHAHY